MKFAVNRYVFYIFIKKSPSCHCLLPGPEDKLNGVASRYNLVNEYDFVLTDIFLFINSEI